MCNDIRTIAEYNEEQLVTRCEHGTIHLHWQRLTLHFSPKEFSEMLAFLEAVVNVSETVTQPRLVYLPTHGCEYVQIWLFGTGLHLPAADFQRLLAMLRTAENRLQGNANSNTPLPISRLVTQLKRPPQTKFPFSLN